MTTTTSATLNKNTPQNYNDFFLWIAFVCTHNYKYSPTTELPDPKAQIQGRSAGTVKLAKPH